MCVGIAFHSLLLFNLLKKFSPRCQAGARRRPGAKWTLWGWLDPAELTEHCKAGAERGGRPLGLPRLAGLCPPPALSINRLGW